MYDQSFNLTVVGNFTSLMEMHSQCDLTILGKDTFDTFDCFAYGKFNMLQA